MMLALAYAILAVVLAVARDVPVIHLILPPDTSAGDRMGIVISLPLWKARISATISGVPP